MSMTKSNNNLRLLFPAFPSLPFLAFLLLVHPSYGHWNPKQLWHFLLSVETQFTPLQIYPQTVSKLLYANEWRTTALCLTFKCQCIHPTKTLHVYTTTKCYNLPSGKVLSTAIISVEGWQELSFYSVMEISVMEIRIAYFENMSFHVIHFSTEWFHQFSLHSLPPPVIFLTKLFQMLLLLGSKVCIRNLFL